MADDEGEDDNEWEPFADLLGQKAIPVFGFRVVSFLDEDGQAGMNWARAGEKVTGGQVLGDVMGAVFELYHRHLHDPEHGDQVL